MRNAVERADNLTESGATAREEIGRAVAARIRQVQTAKELKVVAEEVLPEIEKFLESPEEKRLRRLRTGIIISSIGFGAAVPSWIMLAVTGKEELFMLAVMGTVCFFIGLAFFLNAVFVSFPKKFFDDRSRDAENQRAIDADPNELALPESRQEYVSVVEETTRNLTGK